LARPLELAFVVASRFGLLLGLALWLGVGLATLLLVPIIGRKLEAAQARELIVAILRRVDRVLLASLGVVALALLARVVVDRAAPPTSVLFPLGAMTAARLLTALALGPTIRALGPRLRDANAPATDAERAALRRVEGAATLLLSLEVCLGLYVLFAIS
jgi:hypothetical protein